MSRVVPFRQAVVLDWGGVLTAPLPAAFEAWLVRDRVDPAHFGEVMRAWRALGPDGPGEAAGKVPQTPIHALERGHLPPREFEVQLAAELAARGSTVVPEGLLGRMLAGLEALEPSMIEFVRELRDQGLRTAVLSNSWGEHYPDDVFAAEFDEVVISGRVGLRKPQPEIYRLTADRLGVDVGSCVFIDDLEVNVAAARRVGMAAVHHLDVTTTRREVADLLASLP